MTPEMNETRVGMSNTMSDACPSCRTLGAVVLGTVAAEHGTPKQPRADLVSRLEAGTEFTAEKLTAEDKQAPKIVSYRGHTLLD